MKLYELEFSLVCMVDFSVVEISIVEFSMVDFSMVRIQSGRTEGCKKQHGRNQFGKIQSSRIQNGRNKPGTIQSGRNWDGRNQSKAVRQGSVYDSHPLTTVRHHQRGFPDVSPVSGVIVLGLLPVSVSTLGLRLGLSVTCRSQRSLLCCLSLPTLQNTLHADATICDTFQNTYTLTSSTALLQSTQYVDRKAKRDPRSVT